MKIVNLAPMRLLEASITMDVDKLPFEHLMAIIAFLAAIVVFIFINGIYIKLGEKEINIGGMRRLLAKRDEDTLLKEGLKNFSDEVDRETEASLYDLVQDIGDSLNEALLRGERCWFTHEQFTYLVKRELYKRLRRNNLRQQLSEGNREKYVKNILKDVQEKYELFQRRAAAAPCEKQHYEPFESIKGEVKKALHAFADQATAALMAGMRKKLKEYAKQKPQFKTARGRAYSCDYPTEKNIGYIKILGGEIILLEEKQ